MEESAEYVSLDMATVEQLADELAKRFPYGLLLAGVAPSKNDPDLEDFGVFRRCGCTMAIGIAQRAKDLIERQSNQDQEDEDD